MFSSHISFLGFWNHLVQVVCPKQTFTEFQLGLTMYLSGLKLHVATGFPMETKHHEGHCIKEIVKQHSAVQSHLSASHLRS